MVIGVLKEQTPQESRVALIPAHVGALLKQGYTVLVEKDAGKQAGYDNQAYEDKGAKVIADIESLLEKANIILTIRSGAAAKNGEAMAALLKENQILIGMLEPYQAHPAFDMLRKQKVQAFAMELIPRTTRAQSMDVLSSMANLAGYKAVLMGANDSSKMFPMMMTAAGTITPASVFVLGVGVAGLQAIATAKRLGALISAYDVRAEVKEQVESLGAKFVELDLETAEGEGGYAKKMDEAFYKKQREMMESELADKDVVITTANIPGKKAPILITKAMVAKMKRGSVIVDLAAERGGNCELTVPGKTVEADGVKIVGPLNIPSSLAFNASALYSKNITSFLNNLFEKESQKMAWDDDIVSATAVIKDGAFANEKIKANLGGRQS